MMKKYSSFTDLLLFVVMVLTKVVSRCNVGWNLDVHPAYNIFSLVVGKEVLKGPRCETKCGQCQKGRTRA